MRIAVIGHSMVHERQHFFFREVARLGHDVMLISPATWGDLKALPHEIDKAPEPPYKLKSLQESFELVGLPVVAGERDIYNYDLLGVEKALHDFQPDILYVQQEVECRITQRCITIARQNKWPIVLFVWENLRPLRPEAQETLKLVNMCICGNDNAGTLHEKAPIIAFLPQVGVDIAHFWYRPKTERDIPVGFIGRAVPEKGIEYLKYVWPEAKVPPWRPWRELPWAYSHIKVIVNYSLDTEFWREQAMPYTAAEGLSCQCAAVVSDGGAIRWWLGGGFAEPCPGAIIVPQHRPDLLREAIGQALERWEEMGGLGRAWVRDHLSSQVIAKRLVDLLQTARSL